jgi:metallophosphoesterase superfamily enzyme
MRTRIAQRLFPQIIIIPQIILENMTGTVQQIESQFLSVPQKKTACTIQILSDVHLEFRNKSNFPNVKKCASHLALLGDIGKPFTDEYQRFIENQANMFEYVFVIMGNHEYYNSHKTVDTIIEKARQVCANFPNVHLLERETFDLTDEITILGCTLWSPLDRTTSFFLNDMNHIHIRQNGVRKSLDRITYFSWHIRDVSWLQHELKNIATRNRKAVILTHHGPLLDMSGKFIGSKYNSGFVSDLSHLFVPPAIAFASGHVHSNSDVVLNGIRSVSNALGYPGEETGYKEDVVLEC